MVRLYARGMLEVPIAGEGSQVYDFPGDVSLLSEEYTTSPANWRGPGMQATIGVRFRLL
jgi:hypothetical protein